MRLLVLHSVSHYIDTRYCTAISSSSFDTCHLDESLAVVTNWEPNTQITRITYRYTNFVPHLAGRYLSSNVNITILNSNGEAESVPVGSKCEFKISLNVSLSMPHPQTVTPSLPLESKRCCELSVTGGPHTSDMAEAVVSLPLESCTISRGTM